MRSALRLIAFALVITVIAAAPAAAATDHSIQVTAGEAATWQGGPPLGVNPNYFNLIPQTGFPQGTCSDDPRTYCEDVLVRFTNPVPAGDADGKVKRTATVSITPVHPVADFDLVAFASDAEGTKGANIGQSAGTPIADGETSSETIILSITTEAATATAPAQPDEWVLLHVVYFAAPATYSGEVAF